VDRLVGGRVLQVALQHRRQRGLAAMQRPHLVRLDALGWAAFTVQVRLAFRRAPA
jgi:hypothetical protein